MVIIMKFNDMIFSLFGIFIVWGIFSLISPNKKANQHINTVFVCFIISSVIGLFVGDSAVKDMEFTQISTDSVIEASSEITNKMDLIYKKTLEDEMEKYLSNVLGKNAKVNCFVKNGVVTKVDFINNLDEKTILDVLNKFSLPNNLYKGVIISE